MTTRTRRKERGAVLIGASVFLSIMLVLGFTSYRYGLRLYFQLVAANLASAAGQGAYRDCSHLNEELIPACLRRVRQGVMAAHRSNDFPISAIVTMYTKDGGVRKVASTGPEGRFSSRFSEHTFRTHTQTNYFKDMLEAHEKVCVAEVFIDFVPFNGISFGSGTVYESSLS